MTQAEIEPESWLVVSCQLRMRPRSVAVNVPAAKLEAPAGAGTSWLDVRCADSATAAAVEVFAPPALFAGLLGAAETVVVAAGGVVVVAAGVVVVVSGVVVTTGGDGTVTGGEGVTLEEKWEA